MGGQRHGGKAGTAHECIKAQAPDAVVEHDLRQAGAVGKAIIRNPCERLRKLDLGQILAGIEGVAAQGLQGQGKLNLIDGVVVKRIAADGGQREGEGKILQSSVAIESVITQRCDPFLKIEVFQCVPAEILQRKGIIVVTIISGT